MAAGFAPKEPASTDFRHDHSGSGVFGGMSANVPQVHDRVVCLQNNLACSVAIGARRCVPPPRRTSARMPSSAGYPAPDEIDRYVPCVESPDSRCAALAAEMISSRVPKRL